MLQSELDEEENVKLLFEHLRSKMERAAVKIESDGSAWHAVFLDSAKPTGWSKAMMSGYLSVLAKEGLYERIDGFFGKIKVKV